jgi:hypothetical protein
LNIFLSWIKLHYFIFIIIYVIKSHALLLARGVEEEVGAGSEGGRVREEGGAV